MKLKEYLKELSLTILGVLIALLIDNYREDVRDDKIVRSYLNIVAEDLNLDIQNLTQQLQRDSVYAKGLKILGDELTYNADLPQVKYSLSSWQEHDQRPYKKLSTWDSLDYYTLQLYSNTEYKIRKIGFSTITNSTLSHRIEQDLLKKITIYYTTDSEYLDFTVAIDTKCQWNAIPFLNRFQGSFKDVILTDDFKNSLTLLRNEANGRYSTTLIEMNVKLETIQKAKELLKWIESY
jgi:hypothetical protein